MSWPGIMLMLWLVLSTTAFADFEKFFNALNSGSSLENFDAEVEGILNPETDTNSTVYVRRSHQFLTRNLDKDLTTPN